MTDRRPLRVGGGEPEQSRARAARAAPCVPGRPGRRRPGRRLGERARPSGGSGQGQRGLPPAPDRRRLAPAEVRAPPPSRSALRSSRPEAQAFRRHKLVFPDGNTSVPAVRRLMRSRTGVSRRTTGNKSTGNTTTWRRCAGPPARRWSPAALRRGGNTAGAAHSRRPAGPRPRRCERPRRHAAVQGRLLSGSY